MFLLNIRIGEKTLKFDNYKRIPQIQTTNQFRLSKCRSDSSVWQIKHNDDGFKCFTGYKEGETVKPLCIVLLQMTGYIKYFENGGKNMSFVIKDDDVLDKYNEIWDKIKETLSIKFHSMPVYDKQYIKAKVWEFNGVIKTNFLSDEVPKENEHYTCIACITIDSVMRMEKKNYPQVYLEECKYKIKKTKMTNFIKFELESELESEPDIE